MTALRRHPFARRLSVCSGLLFVVMLAWGLASPVPSGPDESTQIVRAAAVAHGTLIGGHVVDARSKSQTEVRVPGTYANVDEAIRCDYHDIEVAACEHRIATSSKGHSIRTYVGRYPPAYYLLVGLPTLVSSETWTLQAMRVVAALIVALLLGLAFTTISTYSRSGLLTVATSLVITPTVLYFGGVVNPSGMEIAGAIALWAAMSILVFQPIDQPPTALVVCAIVGAAALCASRPLSTLWFALIIGSFALLRPAATRHLLRVRRLRVAFAGTLGFAVLCGLWVVFARSYELYGHKLRPTGTTRSLLDDAGRGDAVLRQVIGAFGSPNFSLPEPLLAIWIIGGFGVIVLAVLLASRRDALVLGGLVVVLGFLLPFVLIYSHIHADGVVWQGRYSLPLLAGLPMLGVLVVVDRHPRAAEAATRRVAVLVIGSVTLGQLGGFFWFLRRYAVGLSNHTVNPFASAPPGSWSPALGAAGVFALYVAADLGFGVWLLRAANGGPGRVDAASDRIRHRATPLGPGRVATRRPSTLREREPRVV